MASEPYRFLGNCYFIRKDSGLGENSLLVYIGIATVILRI